jgi:hypothetical protein
VEVHFSHSKHEHEEAGFVLLFIIYSFIYPSHFIRLLSCNPCRAEILIEPWTRPHKATYYRDQLFLFHNDFNNSVRACLSTTINNDFFSEE